MYRCVSLWPRPPPPTALSAHSSPPLLFQKLITGFIFDFVGLCVERKYHAFEWERVFPTSLRRVLKYVVVILVMGFSRLCVELLQLFCPQDTEEFGIVLRSCDKPSIFQAVNVAFAARNRGTTLGSFIDMNSTTTTF